MYDEIFRNLPGNDHWEGSFYEQLSEDAIWSVDEFWKLHRELPGVALDCRGSDALDRKLGLAVITLHVRISNLLSSHYDQNDAFKIKNVADCELSEFRERLDTVLMSIFSGDVLPASAFELSSH